MAASREGEGDAVSQLTTDERKALGRAFVDVLSKRHPGYIWTIDSPPDEAEDDPRSDLPRVS